jgi:hypothetical protein
MGEGVWRLVLVTLYEIALWLDPGDMDLEID